MKASLFGSIILSLALAMTATAQNFKLKAQAAAVIKDEEGKPTPRQIWILAASDKEMGYLESPEDAEFQRVPMSQVLSVYFFESEDFKKAVDLFEARKYKEAKDLFEQIQKTHEPVASIKNNPGAIAQYYKTECLRKELDLSNMAKEASRIKTDTLTYELMQKQISLYPVWSAVGAREWLKAEELIKPFEKQKVPGFMRAQLSYCHGRTLEGLERPQEALLAYQTALVADSGASEVVVRESALRILEILHNDESVKEAVKAYDASKGEIMTAGYGKVLEGAGVASLFELVLGGGTTLPSKYKYFIKYKLDPNKEEGDEPKKVEKKEE